MTAFEMAAVLAAGSCMAGLLGALTGLGGGVVIVPLLTLGLGVDIRYAIGASLVSVIATSSGAAATYVREGFSNIRIGMFLEIATSIGAIAGAFLAGYVSTRAIGLTFGAVLLYAAFQSIHQPEEPSCDEKRLDRLATWLNLHGSFPGPGGAPKKYCVEHVPFGFGLMFGAGTLSGLLGIGSGALKVIAMDRVMRIPFKVSTTTSNFMIGVTAAASAGVYFKRGYIDPALAMPVMLGVLAGSLVGTRFLVAARTRHLRWVFAGVILILAVEMIYNSASGRL
jgi:hypothetical protein